MNAGATMNSTTPSTRPSTMEIAISFLPNSTSSSMNDFFCLPSGCSNSPSSSASSATASRSARSACSRADASRLSTLSSVWAPSASIIVSGRPKSSFHENGFPSPSTGTASGRIASTSVFAEGSSAAAAPTTAASTPSFAPSFSSASSANAWSAAISSALYPSTSDSTSARQPRTSGQYIQPFLSLPELRSCSSV